MLATADCIVGHNIINFDIPAIQKVYPWFKPQGRILDTLIWCQLQYPTIYIGDQKRVAEGAFPKKLTGAHSLKAYGYRLGVLKGEFGESTDWQHWSQDMSDYCAQDVMVNVTLLERLLKAETSEQALDLELKVAEIISRQERFGFMFNRSEASKLYGRLSQRREEITEELLRVFKPWFKKEKEFTPKGNNKKLGYRSGCTLTKVKLTEFNPSSRQHIASRLKKLFGWKPKEFTPNGQPKIDETVLSKLPWPEAALLTEYFVVNKLIGQLAEGDNAWLRKVGSDSRLHGRVMTLGAVTRRMTHSNPNLAQVPSNKKPFGAECRGLFTVADEHVLVGADASGLELRCLAHYMGAYDGGAYGDIVLHGDIHTANQKAAGLPTRDAAKRFIYAFLYGAGDILLGELVTDDHTLGVQKHRRAGKKVRDQFMSGLPALNALVEAVQGRVNDGGQINSLDGQPLYSRSAHSALNLLLQSCGAIVMKRALVILDDDLQNIHGMTPGVDYEFVGNIHDEWQIEVFNPDNADLVGRAACTAITKAGEFYGFRCKLDGEYNVGKSWKDTH